MRSFAQLSTSRCKGLLIDGHGLYSHLYSDDMHRPLLTAFVYRFNHCKDPYTSVYLRGHCVAIGYNWTPRRLRSFGFQSVAAARIWKFVYYTDSGWSWGHYWKLFPRCLGKIARRRRRRVIFLPLRGNNFQLECVAKPSVMAARPLNGWKLLLGTWVKYATETAVQAWDNPRVTSASH